MAVTAHTYPLLAKSLANKEITLPGDVLKVALVTSSYTPDNSHQYKSQVTGEATGTGYTAGGATLTSITWTLNGSVYTLDAADTTWANSTITARYAVLYDSTPASDAARPLLGYVDFGANFSSTNAAFTLTWDAAGILQVTAS